MKKIFTKEMAVNSIVTLAVVLVALAVNEKFIKPKMASGNDLSSTPAPKTPSATTEA